MTETLWNGLSCLEVHSIKVNKDRTGVFMLKEGATIPFKTIKISCINTLCTMNCDLRKRWSHCHERTCHGRTKSIHLYIFCFLLVSVHSNTAWLFLICPKSVCPLLIIFRYSFALKTILYRIWHLLHIRFMYTIWFLKASNLDFIN